MRAGFFDACDGETVEDRAGDETDVDGAVEVVERDDCDTSGEKMLDRSKLVAGDEALEEVPELECAS